MKFVEIAPVAARPEKCPVADYEKIKKTGPMVVPYSTAIEAVKNSKGGYEIKVEGPPKATMVAPSLEEMADADLKRLYLSTLSILGKRPGKQVTRAQMRQTIKAAEDAIEITE